MNYDYNKPIKKDEFDFLGYKDNGKRKTTQFKYDGKYFELIYNYCKSWGFKFIEMYPNEMAMNNSLRSTGGQTIYSSTLPKDNTEFGTFLEYSLMKIDLKEMREIETKLLNI